MLHGQYHSSAEERLTIHQELAAQENGAATTELRNGPFRNAKRAISHDEMGCFGW